MSNATEVTMKSGEKISRVRFGAFKSGSGGLYYAYIKINGAKIKIVWNNDGWQEA